MEATNAESLHNVGKGKTSPTAAGFVNPGTPAAPLAKFEDLTNPEISKEGSASLQNGLIKDHNAR